MRILLLGPLVVGDGPARLGKRDRIVLSALAMRPGQVLSADQLADAVWGDQAPPSSHKNLQGCVVRLRKLLGLSAIETSGQGYRLAVDPEGVDAYRFEQLVVRARELSLLSEPDRAGFVLDRALRLWRGKPLPDLEGWQPGEIEARRVEELYLEAQEDWLDVRLRSGGHGEVPSEAQAMVSAAPLRERRWHLLALAQYQAGQQGDALTSLRRVRRLLGQELGVDPGPDLIALEQAILRQEPTLLVEATPAEAGAVCPWPGLTPYDINDVEMFFGRDADTAACLEHLARERVLVVVGPSGCGKSSLVRAGVAAALRRQDHQVVVVTPGAHPLRALAAAADALQRPVLVVDQAEELFSLCDDAGERDEFVTALTGHADAAQVVLALRADRMGDVSAHPMLARLVERGLYVLGAMSPDQLRAAIEGPAAQAGLLIEPGLVDLLVREVEDQPGLLPLMSHSLHETWARREGRTLTVSGYQESGGIRGAVAQSAEQVW